MTYRENRLPRITVDDVHAMLRRWRAQYADARLASLKERFGR